MAVKGKTAACSLNLRAVRVWSVMVTATVRVRANRTSARAAHCLSNVVPAGHLSVRRSCPAAKGR